METGVDQVVPLEATPDLSREMKRRGLSGYCMVHDVRGPWFAALKTKEGAFVRAADVIRGMGGRKRKVAKRKAVKHNPRITRKDTETADGRHRWISEKIAALRKEKYPEKQAIAIAYAEMRKEMGRKGRRIPATLAKKKIKRNPRDPRMTKKRRLNRAMKLYSGFREERPDRVGEHELPTDDTGVVMGDCIGIVYQTTIDGKHEKFMHQFTAKAAPMLVTSWDGKHLYLLGGRFRVGPRGIVDQRGR
ncbi:MAG TPA: hypothetical protein ENG77_02925 [Chromatiales bacterium]|nr:hypothetical protein [Chromatiales bacterium]